VTKTKSFCFILMGFCVLYPNFVNGTTIARIGSEELVNKSELIFEGEVIAVRPLMDQRGYIYTFVDFSVKDVIVGEIKSKTSLTLRFTGGTVGETRLDVGARIPLLNEKGIYFVEQIAPGLVNPLFGWTQGHFTISDDDSVIAGNAQKVHAIQRNGNELPEISQGVAKGIVTKVETINTRTQRSANKASSRPMSVDAFKLRILKLKN
jgi:hypothetical protein